MPENIQGMLVYDLICGLRAGTVLVKQAPGSLHEIFILNVIIFFLFSVDYSKYSGLLGAEYYHVNLSAGDCFYIPYKW